MIKTMLTYYASRLELGGQYYPSVVCKLRRLAIDAEEITSGGIIAKGPVINM